MNSFIQTPTEYRGGSTGKPRGWQRERSKKEAGRLAYRLVGVHAPGYAGDEIEPTVRVKSEKRAGMGKWDAEVEHVGVRIKGVGAACGLAAIGLAKNAEWGLRLAIGILAVNLIGDSLNACSAMICAR